MNVPLLYKLIGTRIRAARESSRPRLSQEALGLMVGLTRTSVVNIEAGRQKTPVHVLWQMAEALKVEPEDFMPKLSELRQAEEPIHLDQEAISKIEEAANGDPETRLLLMQFVTKAKSKPRGSNEAND